MSGGSLAEIAFPYRAKWWINTDGFDLIRCLFFFICAEIHFCVWGISGENRKKYVSLQLNNNE
jgi:hypothetical protein